MSKFVQILLFSFKNMEEDENFVVKECYTFKQKMIRF